MAYKGTSIVDYLKSVGAGSTYADREKLAAAAGISNYTGTAAQNTALLAGQQKPVAAVKPAAVTPAGAAIVKPLSVRTEPAGVTPMSPTATPTATPAMGTPVSARAISLAPKPGATPAPKSMPYSSLNPAPVAPTATPRGPAAVPVAGAVPGKTVVAPANQSKIGGSFTAAMTVKTGGSIPTGVSKLPLAPNKAGTAQNAILDPNKAGKIVPAGGTTAPASGTQVPAAGASVAKSQTLRDWATANNYEVSFDETSRMVTVTDPATGKTSSFKDNEAGVDSGIGTKINGQNTISDPAKFAVSMKDAAAAGAEADGVDLNDPDQLAEYLAKFVKDYIDTSTEEDLAAGNEAFQQMLTMFGMDTSAVPVPDIMSFGEAKTQAAEMYDPMYADQKERLTKSMQEASVRSGFAGQLPWQMYEAENQGALERQRTGDIANAANTLVGQSKNDANIALSQGASKRQEMFNMFNTAFNASQGNKNGKFDILKNWMTTLGQKQTTDLNNVRTGQQNDEYLKYTVPLNEQKVREAATKADIAEIDFALKAAEYSISDESNRLKLQKLRQDISNSSSANARAAALNKWQIEAAQMGVAIDAITLDDKSQDIWSKDYTTSKSDFMDKVGMGSTDSTGVFSSRYDRAGLMAVISGYTGITGAERDRLANMIPSSYQ